MQNVRTQRITSVVLLSLWPGVGALAAQAPQPPPGPPPARSIMQASPILEAIDADHDRVITAIELGNAPAALRGLDKNGDGKLTPDEAGMQMPGRGGPGGPGGRGGEPPQTPAPGPTADELLSILMTFDKNKDGKLQKAEVPDRQAGLFERGDTNTDGVLDADELRKVTADQAAAPVAPPRARGRRGFARFDLAATALDTDSNGEIVEEEIAAATAALKVLDKNTDGRITEDEVSPPPPPADAPRGAQP
jgi:Ca2+-binding EF-hand superfamily protein